MQPIEQITLTAPDISCGHCVSTVQQAVGALNGVNHVEANAETKQVSIRFDPTLTNRDQIALSLSAAGYPAQP